MPVQSTLAQPFESSAVVGRVDPVDWHALFGYSWATIRGQLGLSQREVEIVRGIFDDLSGTEIADRIGISRHTVRTHVKRIYQKLHVHRRTGLLLFVTAQVLRQTQTNRPGK